jgi:hypothetical protein
MTEEQWDACIYPSQMIRQKRGVRMSTRKLRLLACACGRRVWEHLSAENCPAVEVAERHADGKASTDELQAVQPAYVQGGPSADNAVHFLTAPNRLFRSWVESALSHAIWAVAEVGPRHEAERLAQCRLIRDLFRNPFRSAPVEPHRRTRLVLSLAQAAYEERFAPDPSRPGWLVLDPARLLILADALEDAGIDEPEILEHLRGSGEHVRGCHVVDAILGKS